MIEENYYKLLSKCIRLGFLVRDKLAKKAFPLFKRNLRDRIITEWLSKNSGAFPAVQGKDLPNTIV